MSNSIHATLVACLFFFMAVYFAATATTEYEKVVAGLLVVHTSVWAACSHILRAIERLNNKDE